MLVWVTPHKVDIIEGVLTLAFFFLLVTWLNVGISVRALCLTSMLFVFLFLVVECDPYHLQKRRSF